MTAKTHMSIALAISSVPMSLPFFMGERGMDIFHQYTNFFIKNLHMALSELTSGHITEFLSIMIFFFIVVFGSLIPDLDHNEAYLTRKIKKIPLLNFVIIIFSNLVKHRGPTHSFLWQGMFFILLMVISHIFNLYLLKAIIPILWFGAILHVVGDMFTVSGVRIYTPLTKEVYRLLPKRMCITTNSFTELKLWLPLASTVFFINMFIFITQVVPK